MTTSSSAPSGDLTSQILQALSEKSPLLSSEAFPAIAFQDIKAALDRLASRSMITYETIDKEEAILEPEAEQIAEHGSHEARVFEALRNAVEGLSIQDLEKAIGDKTVTKVGQGKAFKEKWIKKSADGKLVATAESIEDVTQAQLQKIKETRTHEPKILTDLRKRKLIKMQKTANFKPYNFKALGADQNAGALHPLNKVRHEFRQIFFEMGFEEMPTNKFVETGFWNFDALFVPQQHPARDLQDTFYISDPKVGDAPRSEEGQNTEEYWENIKQVHQNGKFGSIGYRYPWSAEETKRLVLRTHTTAISTAMLYKLAAQKGPDGRPPPARYFSIDRVFRNETVDATHLAEFHQVEGVIADYGLTLGGLMEFMEVFFAKMGITNLKFKPAYNPYTEPSMEIFSYHEGLGKLVEIGNSGMFRPEMLEPMGLPKDMRVFGWGLSLERPTMIKYKISNIRELLGHKVDLNFIERNPAVRLEKE
ncbi:hypothetical protein ACJA88_003284 [Fusarium oxysporum]